MLVEIPSVAEFKIDNHNNIPPPDKLKWQLIFEYIKKKKINFFAH